MPLVPVRLGRGLVRCRLLRWQSAAVPVSLVPVRLPRPSVDVGCCGEIGRGAGAVGPVTLPRPSAMSAAAVRSPVPLVPVRLPRRPSAMSAAAVRSAAVPVSLVPVRLPRPSAMSKRCGEIGRGAGAVGPGQVGKPRPSAMSVAAVRSPVVPEPPASVAEGGVPRPIATSAAAVRSAVVPAPSSRWHVAETDG